MHSRKVSLCGGFVHRLTGKILEMLELISWSLLFLFCTCIGFVISPVRDFRFQSRSFRLVCATGLGLCVLWIFLFHLEWTRQPIRFDHVPAGVTLLSQAVAAMKPVFFSGPGGEIQLLPYGPYVFLLGSVLMPFFDNPFTADGVAGLVLFWSSVVLMSTLFIRRLGANNGLAASLVFCSFLIFVAPHRFELKETVVMFGAALALFSGFSIRNSASAMVFAGFGLAVALSKPQAAFAVMALAPLIVRERGVRWTAGAAGIFLFFALAVFAHPSFSLEGFFSITLENFHQINDFWGKDLRWPVIAGVFVIAVLIGSLRGKREKFVLTSAVIMSAAYLSVLKTSTIVGSGTDQIFYIIPPLMILAGEKTVREGFKNRAGLVFGGWFIAVLLALSVPFGSSSPSPLQMALQRKEEITRNLKPSLQFEKEIRKISEIVGGFKTEVGTSDLQNYIYFYSAKPFLFRNGNTVSHFPVSMMELDLTAPKRKNEYLSAQISALESEKMDIFLVPVRGKMFSMISFLPPHRWVFGKNYASVFSSRYKRIGTIGSYAVFAAKSRSGQISGALRSRVKTVSGLSPLVIF